MLLNPALFYTILLKIIFLNKMEVEKEKQILDAQSNESSENEEVFVSDSSEKEDSDDNTEDDKNEDEWKVGEQKFDENLINYVNTFPSRIKPGPIEISNILNIKPFDIFSLFLGDEIFQHIGEQSDKYINEIMKNEKRKKKPFTSFKYYTTNIIKITSFEIKAFLAVIIIMGMKKLPKQSDHWQVNPLYADPKITGIMPRDLFNTLKCAFHLDDNSLYASEPFGKLHTIINTLNLKNIIFSTKKLLLTKQ